MKKKLIELFQNYLGATPKDKACANWNEMQNKLSDEVLSTFLDLQCARTGNPIEEGEVVKLFNWGMKRYVIGYGAYVWDEQEKGFILEVNHDLNMHYNLSFHGIDDRYDLFRTSPEKLTAEEKKILI